ncbi:MAG: hypothetical protein ACM3ML_19330 [Micromonosporaceae bacterium]
MDTGHAVRDDPKPARAPIQILADRMAAGLTRREPGYPLPRRSALARRFQVTIADVDAAIEELVGRRLLRRLPTGELHRAGPAEYVVRLDGMAGLSSFIDPMDHAVSCAAVRVSRLRAPADVAGALGLAPQATVRVRRCLWTADGGPAASLVTYVRDEHARLVDPRGGDGLPGGPDESAPVAVALDLPGSPDQAAMTVRTGAVRIEVQPPARSVARRLRLANGAPAVMVTARLDGGAPPAPVALTVLTLRPDMFRIVLDARG